MIEACVEMRSGRIAAQHDPLDCCRDAEAAEQIARQIGYKSFGIILHLTAMADGDYCDLGEAITNLARRLINERNHGGLHHEHR